MSRLKVYTYRNSSDTFLPADVIAALDEHSHIRQGRMFIWAASAVEAVGRLAALSLSYRSARVLQLAAGPTVDGLAAACDWPAGTVLAMRLSGRSPVIEITDPSSDDVLALSRRALRRVGVFSYDGHLMPLPEHGEGEIEVTDSMVNAALNSYPSLIPDFEQMRDAITAALRARKATS
jgi:hypothetical protein